MWQIQQGSAIRTWAIQLGKCYLRQRKEWPKFTVLNPKMAFLEGVHLHLVLAV
jgi:hypothetical protein